MADDNNNSDYMSGEMDELLKRVEKLIEALYSDAVEDIGKEFSDFMAKYEPFLLEMQELLEQGYITQAEYQNQVAAKILRKNQYENELESLANILVDTDIAARAVLNGTLPYVIASSYNFEKSLGWAAADKSGLSVGTFQVYNAETVQKLIKDNPDVLTYVNKDADYSYNKDKINKVITQSIISGDDIGTIAKKLQQVTGMDETAAIRAARTGMTAAENLGRAASYEDMKKAGVPVVFEWSAHIDERTRKSHVKLNGTYRDEKTGYFGVGILPKDHYLRYAGDPKALPAERYNCRCRCGAVFPNSIIDHSKDDELYEQFMKENYPDDWNNLKMTEKGLFEPKKGTETAKTPPKEIKLKPSDVTNALDVNGVKPLPYDLLEKPLTDEEIIAKIAGGDKTRGSCMSVACAFAGNKAGYDVSDFRGGNSQAVISRNGIIKKISEFAGVDSYLANNVNDYKGAKEVLLNAVENKLYILTTGKHAAVVKYDGTKYYYLEMQSGIEGNNTWKTLDDTALKNRFGCKRSHSVYGMKYAMDSLLIDIELLGNSEEFAAVLQYINSDKPMKGGGGYEK